MTLFKLAIKNLRKFKKDIEADEKQVIKAAHTAVKVEGFRLSKLLKEQIKEGAPGGRPFSPLSEIAKRMRRPMNRTPLRRLAIAVRYAARKKSGGLGVEVGFVDPGRGKALSKSWKRIAEQQQKGFTRPITAIRRRSILLTAMRLGKRAKGRQYLFLKKTTEQFTTPARPIIAPFWIAHRSEAEAKIKSNFERKMAGQRI